MTIPMDCTISYTAGTVFAISSGNAIKGDPEKANKSLRRGRIFTTLVTIPIGLYFLARWPDWSWEYYAGEHARSPILGALGLGGYLASHEIGFRSAAKLIKSNKDNLAVVQAVSSFIFFCLIVVAGWNRFRWQGTLDEFKSGTARDAIRSPGFMITLFCCSSIFFIIAVILAISNYIDTS